MTSSKLPLRAHRSESIIDQLFGILANLTVEISALACFPRTGDGGFFSAKARELGSDPQSAEHVAGIPAFLEFLQFGFHWGGAVPVGYQSLAWLAARSQG